MKTINRKKSLISLVIVASALSFLYLNFGLDPESLAAQELIQYSAPKFSDVTIVKHFLEQLIYTFSTL